MLSDFKATARRTGASLKKIVPRSSGSESEEAGKVKPGENPPVTIKVAEEDVKRPFSPFILALHSISLPEILI